MRVEHDGEAVGLGVLIASGELSGDPARLPIVQSSPHIQGCVIVGDSQLSLLRGRFAFVGLALRERRRSRCAQPDLVVQLAIDNDCRSRPDCLDHRDGPVSGRLCPADAVDFTTHSAKSRTAIGRRMTNQLSTNTA